MITGEFHLHIIMNNYYCAIIIAVFSSTQMLKNIGFVSSL